MTEIIGNPGKGAVMSDAVELNGTVEDIFGHRFTLAAQGGKYLVDLGPHGSHAAKITTGQTVSVKGEQKPGEVKAASLRLDDGDWIEIEQPTKDKVPKSQGKDEAAKPVPKPASDDGEHEVPHDDVVRALSENGYTDAGEPVRKPKHVEIEATKDGTRHTVHVHKGGVVKKADPVA